MNRNYIIRDFSKQFGITPSSFFNLGLYKAESVKKLVGGLGVGHCKTPSMSRAEHWWEVKGVKPCSQKLSEFELEESFTLA